MNPTQIKLIQAAEHEFADHGFHGTSIRDITSRAGANVASVNYHFKSKEGLFMAMIRYRIEPLNALRLKLLQEYLDENQGKPIPLETLIDIMVRPLVNAFHQGSGRKAFIRAMERGMSEEEKFTDSLYQDVLAELITTFRHELGRTLSNAPAGIVDTCFAYISGCISGTFQRKPHRNQEASAKQFPDADHLAAFIAGGIEKLVTTLGYKT